MALIVITMILMNGLAIWAMLSPSEEIKVTDDFTEF